MESEYPEDKLLDEIRRVLLDSGYAETSRTEHQLGFVRELTHRTPKEKSHELRISVETRMNHSIAVVDIFTSPQTDDRTQLEIEEHVQTILGSVLHRASQFHEGVITPDGKGVQLRGRVLGTSLESTPNLLSDLRRSSQILFVACAVSFYFMAFLCLAVFLTDQMSERAFYVTSGIFFFFATLSLYAIVYTRTSRKMPASVLPSFKGIYLQYRSRPDILIPWERFHDVVQRYPNEPWRLYYKDDSGRRRYVKVAENVAEIVWEASETARQLGDYKDTLTFKALNIAPPGTKVLVSEAPLTDDELRYNKLSRRWLSDGPFVPVYVSIEDDIRLTNEAVDKEKLTVDDLKTIAGEAISHESYDLAADISRRVLEIEPDDEVACYHLGGCLSKLERFEEGLEIVDKFLSRHPDSSRCHTMRAILSNGLQRVEEALHHVGQAVEFDPNNLEALEMWMDIVASEAGSGQAIAEMDYVSGKYPDAWGPHLIIGYRLLQSGEGKDAVDRMKKAYEMDANDDTLFAFSNALLSEDKVDEAIRVLEAAAFEEKIGPGPLINLASAYSIIGNKRRALETLDKLEPDVGHTWLTAAERARQRILAQK